jgi:hypothetical protein
VANIDAEAVVMKEEPNLVSHNLKYFVPMVKSLFIDLCDSSDKDGPFCLDVVVLLCVNSWLAEE